MIGQLKQKTILYLEDKYIENLVLKNEQVSRFIYVAFNRLRTETDTI